MYLFQVVGHIILFLHVLFFPDSRGDSALTDQIRQEYPFQQGEKIEYKMKYSFFTVGKEMSFVMEM